MLKWIGAALIFLAPLSVHAQATSGVAAQFPPQGVSTGKLGSGYPDGWAQHATLSNKLLAYWPLNEPTGALSFRDPHGGYTLRALQGSTITSVAGVPTTAQRFLRSAGTAVADLVVTPSATQGQATFTSASAALPVYAAGDHFQLASATQSWVGRAIAAGTSSSVLVERDGADDYAVLASASALGTFIPPNVLIHGYNALGGFGGFGPDFGRYQDSTIHTSGNMGVTYAFWIRIPTGAPLNKVYFHNGTAFAATIVSSDANSTQLNFNCTFSTKDGAFSATAGNPLPALDTWYFYVCSYDPVARTATANRNAGASIVTGAAMGGTLDPNVGYEFGAGHVLVGGNYRGFLWGGSDLHGVGIWNRVLTSTEISFLYNAGAGRVY